MEYRYAVADDAPFLADINRQLIEDEWDGGGMSLERLEARMRRWLEDEDYKAVIFQENGAAVAYSLVSVDEDSAYIRHFFVLHEHRGRGVGRRAFETLVSEIVPGSARLTLDVLARNEPGRAFWRSVGFRDYAIRLERLPEDAIGATQAHQEESASAG
jgi:GNAT superfamily N-acetyltransferase